MKIKKKYKILIALIIPTLIIIDYVYAATNAKVSALTELAVTPADSDELYINDGGTSKKIQYSTLMDGAALKDDSIQDASINWQSFPSFTDDYYLRANGTGVAFEAVAGA